MEELLKKNVKDYFQKKQKNQEITISLNEWVHMFHKELFIQKALFNLGLISKDGGGHEMPEWDQDLELETLKQQTECDERIERIKNGLEHIEQVNNDEL